VKKQCGIYYFEVQIVSKGVDGHIGIGLCRNINSLDRLPGKKKKREKEEKGRPQNSLKLTLLIV
jgi:hypothetical protein